MAYLLGVDIGTSGTKTVLFDDKGRVVASALAEYPLYQPKIGWAEQEPEDWWAATTKTVAEVVKKSAVNPRDIKGIGLSGQMHGLVMLNKSGQVLRKAIIWCDQRTIAECEEMTSILGKEKLIAITGNPALTGYTASKVMWVKNNEPQVFDNTHSILLPKDFIRLRMTGEYASEMSDASGMQLMDVTKRAWSDEVLGAFGIPKQWMAKLYESYEVSGKLTREAAATMGLWEGMPVVGGAGDQAAGAVGNGIVRPGVVSSTIGTSGVVFAHTDKVFIDPKSRIQTLCHAVPGAWHVMGVTQGAGLSLRWARDEFCRTEKAMAQTLDIDTYELITQEAQMAAPGCGGLIYLPYLMGERTPHLDPYAKGVFFGLSAIHTRREMLRAVMEGVSYSLLDCLSAMRELGLEINEVRASGGGSRSPLWREMQADMFGTDIVTLQNSEGPAMGVALLAGVGTGVYGSVPEACDAVLSRQNTLAPDAERSKTYASFYPVYKALYPALKPSFDAVAELVK